MKIAVYTIALNEEQFVERWYESAKEADYLLIADTGSTDDTLRVARKFGINTITIGVRPWRFDDARNASLAAIPLDIGYCIALDMDEILMPGWRKHLEKAKGSRPRYRYIWSWDGDKPGLEYGGDKIHARHGYRWKHPVHEVLQKYGPEPETQEWVGLEIHHHPDDTKSRSQYLPLLELAVQEDPHDDRNAFYLAREYFFRNAYDKATAEFLRHLGLPRAVWAPERAASMRYLAKMENDDQRKVQWWEKAIQQAPDRREAYVELGMHHYVHNRWQDCYDAIKRALEITDKPLEYLCEDFAWNSHPHDLIAISSYMLGKRDEAIYHGEKACELAPGDNRLQQNLWHYRA